MIEFVNVPGPTLVKGRPSLLGNQYSGCIVPQDNGKFVGVIKDQKGWSQLSVVRFTGDMLEFNKCFGGQTDVIHFTFERKSDGVWIGNWVGPNGKGVCTFVSMEVEDVMFDPQVIADMLGCQPFTPPGQ